MVKIEGNFSLIEKLFDEYVLNYVKKAKYITFGIEPLIGYFFAKKTECINIRNIITGKINRLPSDVIKQRLRKTYI